MKVILLLLVMAASLVGSHTPSSRLQHGLLGTQTNTLDKTKLNPISKLIEEALTEENIKLILSIVSKQQDDLLYHGYVKIFQTIKRKQLNDGALFELANQIKNDFNRGQVSSLSSLFPKAVWSLFTSAVSCIKNKGFNEYLYAGLNNFTYDLDRRNIATWRPHGTVDGEEQWRFTHIESNRFYIKSKMFDEYLYADEGAFNFDDDRRSVFTWMKYWPEDNYSNVWALDILPGEDAIKLRNFLYDEPLYPLNNDHIHDQFRRAVFTWIPKDFSSCNGGFHQCKWIVSDC